MNVITLDKTVIQGGYNKYMNKMLHAYFFMCVLKSLPDQIHDGLSQKSSGGGKGVRNVQLFESDKY